MNTRRWFVIFILITIFVISMVTHMVLQVIPTGFGNYLLPSPLDKQLYISLQSTDWWGSGNQLFGFAALIGVANTHNHTWQPCLPEKVEIRRIFVLSEVKVCTTSSLGEQKSIFRETAYAIYDPRSENLPRHSSMVLAGYYQSWKYFANARNDIEYYLKFQPKVKEMAKDHLAQKVEEHFKCKSCVQDKVLVGVHMRQGDLTQKHVIEAGYKVAPIEYLHRAFSYMLKQIYSEKSQNSNDIATASDPVQHNVTTSTNSSSHNNHVFVVCSDDINWCKKKLGSRSDVIYLTQRSNPQHYRSSADPDEVGVDLAILSQCHHTIMTVGTFGWWAAYLTGGTTVYYKDWPTNNSKLWNTTSHRDYFPPHWIGLK